METKTHYRKVFKSDHLGAADLEDLIESGKQLVFTIANVKQEFGVAVAGKKGDYNIAYFKEKIKPLVLNSTNSKVVKSFAGGSPFVEDWTNIAVELYIDENVKMKGEIVSGVRIRTVQPKVKVKPAFTEDKIEAAKVKGATIEFIRQHYSITPEMEQKFNEWISK